jgi:hypothetical protein
LPRLLRQSPSQYPTSGKGALRGPAKNASHDLPIITEIVPATLTGKINCEVSVILQILELWGNNSMRDDFVIEVDQLTPITSVLVQPGAYTLDYEYDGKAHPQTG